MNVMTAAVAGLGALVLAFLVFKPGEQPAVETESLPPFVGECRENLGAILRKAVSDAEKGREAVPFYVGYLATAKIKSLCACTYREMADSHSSHDMVLAMKLLSLRLRMKLSPRNQDRTTRKAERAALRDELQGLVEQYGVSLRDVARTSRDVDRAMVRCWRS